MPTNKRPLVRGRVAAPIEPAFWAALNDAPIPDDANPFWEFVFPAETLWREHATAIVAKWITSKTGSRSSHWWLFSAPEPSRRRLSGKGTPCHEGLNEAPSFHLGIPTRWVDSDLINYYSTQNGAPYAYAEHFDRASVPVYESQAAFLLRHKLLLDGERKRLTAADLEPEPLPRAYWPPEPSIRWRKCGECGDIAGDQLRKCLACCAPFTTTTMDG